MKDNTKEETIVENLKDIKEVFDKHDIACWLDWGTLLGAVRNGKIIEWDHEVDLGIMRSDEEKIVATFSEIKEKGFCIKKAPISAPEFTFRRTGYGVDIWEYYPIGQNLLATRYHELSKNLIAHILWFVWRVLAPGYGKDDLPKKGLKFAMTCLVKCIVSLFRPKVQKFLIQSIRRLFIQGYYRNPKQAIVPKPYLETFKAISFYGMSFNIPFDAEKYLEYKYGKKWKVPVRKWCIEEDGAVRFSKEQGR